MLPCGGDLVHFAMTVLKTPSLRLERFEFPDAEAPKARYASGRETVFLGCVGKERRHVVPANERAVDPIKLISAMSSMSLKN